MKFYKSIPQMVPGDVYKAAKNYYMIISTPFEVSRSLRDELGVETNLAIVNVLEFNFDNGKIELFLVAHGSSVKYEIVARG